MNKKFTKAEKSWIMYDWANSVYATNIMAAIFPIYFGTVCAANGVDNVVLWSIGTSIATFFVALTAPFLGALGDNKGYKKKFFSVFLALGVLFTLFCAFTDNYIGLLIGYIISHIGFCGSNLFYDAFITDVTTKDRMDKVSSWGYAMGYIGGSTIPFIVSIAIMLIMGMTNIVAIKIVIVITALWWFIFSLPFLKNVKQIHYVEKSNKSVLSSSLKNLSHTFSSIINDKGLLFFILAYFFYIDGVSTIISVSTSYGTSLGLDTTGMIMALLVTQIVAVPCSIIFGKLSEKHGSLKLISIAVVIYLFICGVGYYMGYVVETSNSAEPPQLAQTLFWVLAFMVGTVQGGIQSISRSYFSKLIPPERSNEYFGFFDIFGKFAAVIGPALVAVTKTITGSDALSIFSVAILFVLGIVFYISAKRTH
ncbi:MAG: MFS transporter, partial [Clostridia bacterium]